jgi:Bestrophin, RFP-TM, chloride channel
MNNALCPMLLFLFWAINVESFQNGAAYRTLQHRKRIRNSNNNNAFKEPNLQYPLEYKSSTLVGDNELHGLWFPEMSNRTTESKAVAHDIPTATATAPPPAINNRHSSADWLYNLMTIPSSTVLRETKGPVLALAGWATFVSVLHQTFVVMGKRYAASVLSIPSSAHGFVVSSLGLLLVFRTNSAYQRFQVRQGIDTRLSGEEGLLSRQAKNAHATALYFTFLISGGSQDLGEYSFYYSKSVANDSLVSLSNWRGPVSTRQESFGCISLPFATSCAIWLSL